jgi:hypothetical protein
MLPQRRLPVAALILVVALTCSLNPIVGLARTGADNIEYLDGLVKCLHLDTKHVFLSLLRWQRNDLLLFASLSAGTVGLMSADEDSRQIVQRNRKHTPNRADNSLIAGLRLSGLVSRDQRARATALLCPEAITVRLKYRVGRHLAKLREKDVTPRGTLNPSGGTVGSGPDLSIRLM